MPRLTFDNAHKINRFPPLIIYSLHVNFESDWTKTVVSIPCPQVEVWRTRTPTHSRMNERTNDRILRTLVTISTPKPLRGNNGMLMFWCGIHDSFTLVTIDWSWPSPLSLLQEQDKSSDVEKQPPFGDPPNKVVHCLKWGGGQICYVSRLNYRARRVDRAR